MTVDCGPRPCGDYESQRLPGHHNRCALFRIRSGDCYALRRGVAGDRVLRTGSDWRLRIVGYGDDVLASNNGEINKAGAIGCAGLADFRGGRGDRRWQVAAVVDRVLVHRIEDGVHVGAALRVAGIAELLGRVDRHDDDAGEDRDEPDEKEQLDESKSSFERTGLQKKKEKGK